MTIRRVTRALSVYHVEIETKLPHSRFIVGPNLSKPILQERIITPYEQGNPITLRGVSVSSNDIVRITIAGTFHEVHNSNSRERLGVFLRGVNAKDATDSLIVGAPGWKARLENESQSEQLSFSQVYDRMVTNEELRGVTRKRFLDGQYSDAVEAAFKLLNNVVKEESGIGNQDGAGLMRTAFSLNSSILFLNAFQSRSDRDEQLGYMEIFAGSMTGIRNPRAHNHQLADSPEVALELLMLANHLMRKLYAATKAGPAAPTP